MKRIAHESPRTRVGNSFHPFERHSSPAFGESRGTSLAQPRRVGGIIGKLGFEHDETLAIPALEQKLATAVLRRDRRSLSLTWSLLMREFWFRESVDGDAAPDGPFEYEYAILRAA